MKKLKTFFHRFSQIRGLKYVVVAVIAVVLVGFVDENSVWRHLRNKQYISELQEEIDIYTERYHRDQAQIHKLDSDPKAIQKIARERYFMKADDEDIFVLSDDEKPFTQNDSDEGAN
jgi:cell division protein FtsB